MTRRQVQSINIFPSIRACFRTNKRLAALILIGFPFVTAFLKEHTLHQESCVISYHAAATVSLLICFRPFSNRVDIVWLPALLVATPESEAAKIMANKFS
jgi:hypothetical protein